MDYFHQLKKLPPKFDVLIPFLKFEKELESELLLQNKTIYFKNEKIIVVESLSCKPIWSQDWWPLCEQIAVESKSQLVQYLKSQKNLGVYHQSTISPLADSIRRDLRELKLKRIEYQVPSSFNFKYFAWTLIENHTLIVCKTPISQFPMGWHEFNEDKQIPPNRAYLKVWEVLCLGYIQLKPDDVAIDLGSSPGGWSWALSQQIKKVYSVDKAELDPKISQNKNILFKSDDAFKVNPQDYSDCTWLFSDIICTPKRLFVLVNYWQQNSNVKNFVCTIKFKGACDFDIMKEFLKIENSKIIHLYQNKNEVTWIKNQSIISTDQLSQRKET